MWISWTKNSNGRYQFDSFQFMLRWIWDCLLNLSLKSSIKWFLKQIEFHCNSYRVCADSSRREFIVSELVNRISTEYSVNIELKVLLHYLKQIFYRFSHKTDWIFWLHYWYRYSWLWKTSLFCYTGFNCLVCNYV